MSLDKFHIFKYKEENVDPTVLISALLPLPAVGILLAQRIKKSQAEEGSV